MEIGKGAACLSANHKAFMCSELVPTMRRCASARTGAAQGGMHHEIWKNCQSACKAHAEAPQNLLVAWRASQSPEPPCQPPMLPGSGMA